MPYGVDPVFRLGTTLYDPILNDVGMINMANFYDCTQLKNATYDYFDPIQNRTTNQFPRCSELFKPTDVPYAFHRFELEGKPSGFPFYYDINLGEDAAQRWFSYMEEVRAGFLWVRVRVRVLVHRGDVG